VADETVPGDALARDGTIDPGPTGLAALEARLARDLTLLNQPAANWIDPRAHPVHGPALDVAIIGAGMAGLAAAFALIRQGVRNLRLFDAAEEGQEGPWVTYARMETLRSPPQLVGPALGMASLTFRAWFEAQFGAGEWEALYRIPRTQWMDYLRWYRRVLDLPVENGWRMTDLDHDGELLLVTLRQGGTQRVVPARRVVLATGRDGLGGPVIPELYKALPPDLRAHSSDEIDFSVLRGRSIAVVGIGASAVDNAATALEAGAGHVTMLGRRAAIPRINKGMGVSSAGFNLGYLDLSPEQRLRISTYLARAGSPPPRGSMLRLSRHRNLSIRTSCTVTSVRAAGGKAILATNQGEMAFDFVILGTGFGIDLSRRPELAHLAPHIRSWGEAVADTPPEAGPESPYLGPWFEFQPREPGTARWVERVTCFNFAATLSQYKLTGDIPAISPGAERLAEGLIRSFFVEDFEDMYERLRVYSKPELLGDEWVEDAAS
jgi:FAD-dependent urate hydroxylase